MPSKPNRRQIVRVLLCLAAWGGLVTLLGWLLPYEPRVKFSPPEGERVVQLSNTHRTAITSNRNVHQLLWDVETGKMLAKIAGDRVACEYTSDDSLLIVKMKMVDEINILDTNTGESVYRKETHIKNDCWLSPDGRRLALDNGRSLTLWDTVHRREEEAKLDLSGWVYYAEFSPDGRWCVGYYEFEMFLWDTATGRKWSFDIANFWFLPDGITLALHDRENHSGKLWDLAAGRVRKTFEDPEGIVDTPRFTQDGRIMAIEVGNRVELWDTATGRKRNTINRQIKIRDMNIDGTRIITDDRTPLFRNFFLWDTTATPAQAIERNIQHLPFFSADGTILFLVNEDNLDLTDTTTGQLLCRVPSEHDWLNIILSNQPPHSSLKITSDSRTLVVNNVYLKQDSPPAKVAAWLDPRTKNAVPLPSNALLHRGVEIWDVHSGRRTALLEDCSIHGLSPDGRSLATIAEDNTLQLWDLPLRKPWGRALGLSLLMAFYALCVWRVCVRLRRG